MEEKNSSLDRTEGMSEEKEMSFKDIFDAIWINRFLVLTLPIVIGLVTAIYTYVQPNVYKAEILLASSESSSQGRSVGQSSLAALAGISLPTMTDDKTLIAIETLKSRKFVSDFLIKHEALSALMEPKSWDQANDVLEVGEYQGSIQMATNRFMKIFSVEKLSTRTPFVLMTIEHISPTQARDWLELMVVDLNQNLSQRDVKEARESIKYLREQIKNTKVEDIKQLFYRMIESQTSKAMLAEVRPEYAFRVIDPPVAPELKHYPKRAFITLLSIVYSLVGIIILCVLLYLNNTRLSFTRSFPGVSLSKINGIS